MARIGIFGGLFGLLLVIGVGCADIEPTLERPEGAQGLALERIDDVGQQVRDGDFCSVNVQGYGWRDLERDYLPKVVACEHGGADFETLKAQAIAARSIALYKVFDERVPSIAASTAAQHYDCGRAPSDAVRRAVEATQGQVLTYDGYIVAAFYKAGAERAPGDATCSASGGPYTRTEAEITRNENRTGDDVRQSSIGWVDPANKANRGAMGQNEALCLERERGYTAREILEYFYGADIQITQLEGPCFDPNPSEGAAPAPPSQSCVARGARPAITARAAWGARSARALRPRHQPDRITIHHTVGAMGRDRPASLVRAIQNYHLDVQGWSDIAYHYLISADGSIFEGSAPTTRQGAHVFGGNRGNLGIALMGNFERDRPTEAQLKAAGELSAWLAEIYDIDLAYDAARPGAGTLLGHRHNAGQSTACPGTNLVAQMTTILSYATTPASCDGGGSNAPPSSTSPNTPDLTLDGAEMRLDFVSPRNHATISKTSRLAVDADPRITRVVYFAGIYEFEESADPSSGFARTYTFNQLGQRILTAKGYNAAGEFVGKAQIAVDITDASLSFEGLVAGASYPRSFTWQMGVFDSQIQEVVCEADGWPVGRPATAAEGWRVSHSFSQAGVRRLACQGRDASGAVVAATDLSVSIDDAAPGLAFLSPGDGGWYRISDPLEFRARAFDARISRVSYVAEGKWAFGASSEADEGFAYRHQFSHYGARLIEAVGYDAQGREVGRAGISIRITDADGAVPADAQNVVGDDGGL